jgi:hypothetical protein
MTNINLDLYSLVTWPESQGLMDQEWFDECILMNDIKHLDNIGSSAYFVPLHRMMELSGDDDTFTLFDPRPDENN